MALIDTETVPGEILRRARQSSGVRALRQEGWEMQVFLTDAMAPSVLHARWNQPSAGR